MDGFYILIILFSILSILVFYFVQFLQAQLVNSEI